MLKLEAPAHTLTGPLNGDHQQGQTDEGGEDAGRKCQPVPENMPRILASLLDKAEHFERDNRQHAGHKVQNQASDKGKAQVNREAQRSLSAPLDMKLLIQDGLGRLLRG